jgi:ATP phosphoribosyltransferase regulatory subunit
MNYPIPPGTRDILPDEMRELRALSTALLDTFQRFGYGEVWTPTMEYEDVLVQGDERAAGASYRLFDENGQVLALRSDMTIPIARLVATRYEHAQTPLRFCYLSHAYRAVTPQRGQQREFLQAGVELIGADAPDGTVEVIEVLSAALDAADLPRARIGLGDAGLYRGLLAAVGAGPEGGARVLAALERHDLVELERSVADLGLSEDRRRTLVALPQLRGGADVIERAVELGGEHVRQATQRLGEVAAGVEDRGLADRVIFDLGLVRDLGYYTGAIFDVYDPALGHVIGGGGRYDELLGRFGRSLPACGFGLFVERLHVAQAEEERRAQPGEGS